MTKEFTCHKCDGKGYIGVVAMYASQASVRCVRCNGTGVVTQPFKAEMRPAYQWTCDECGVLQFESAMVADFNEEDRLETAKSLGIVDEFCEEIPEDMTGDFVTYPDEVTCRECGATFETQHMHGEDESE